MAPWAIRSVLPDVRSPGLSVGVACGRLGSGRGVRNGSVETRHCGGKCGKEVDYLPSEPLVIYRPRGTRDLGGRE